MWEFIVQVLAGIASTVVGTLLVTLILARTRRERWDPVKLHATNGRGGAQVVAGDRIAGDLTVEVDNSRRIVINNIRSSEQSAPATSDQGARTSLAGLMAIVAAGLFVVHEQIVIWFVVGVAVGLVITLVAAIARAIRYRLWEARAAIVALEVLLSLTAVAWTCIGVSTVRFAGNTIGELGKKVSDAVAAEPGPSGTTSIVRALLEPVKQLFILGFANGQLTFAVMMLASVVLSVLLAVMAGLALYDWLSFTGFYFGTTTNARMAVRAARFNSRTAASVLPPLLLCAIVCLLASGWVMTFLHPAAVLPLAQ